MNVPHRVSRLHQVLITDGLGLPNHLPQKVIDNRDHALNLYPHANYKLWSGEELRCFLADELGKDVLKAFDTLTPYSYKCDLARYSLLYVYGGVYFDLAVRLLNPWEIPERCGVAAFTEMYPGMESWTATQTSLLWSEPKRSEWRQAIDWIVENCREQFYGPHDHYPTAGALLGRSFAAALAAKGQSFEADDQWIGECRYVTPERQPQNLCYVAPDRKIVGLRTKLAAGDLGELGLMGTNNYTRIYRNRQVYGETVRRWSFKDPRIVADPPAEKTATGLGAWSGFSGRICYGPFVDLAAGYYTVLLEFSPTTMFSCLKLNISANYARQHVADFELDGRQRESLSFDFHLGDWTESVEFRVSLAEFKGELRSISLKPAQFKRTWAANDPSIEVVVGKVGSGIAIPEGYEGRVSWGPYAQIAAGSYLLCIQFDDKTECKEFKVEICHGGGMEIVACHLHKNDKRAPLRTIEFSFNIVSDIADLEFRTEAFGNIAGCITQFTLISHSAGELVEQPILIRS